MRVLLDTCSFLWLITASPDLSRRARELIVDPENDVYLSAVSTWEIALKNAIGRLPLPEPPARFIPEQREKHFIDRLDLDEESTLHLDRLPPLHRDPFDRMLVCQAVVHGLVIVGPDPLLVQYPVRTHW